MADQSIMPCAVFIFPALPCAVIQIKPAEINKTKAIEPIIPNAVWITFPTIDEIDFVPIAETGLSND